MGMDVFGKKPTSEVGTYFRANVWYWHPLWLYCEMVHPNIANKVENGHSNSGDGLNSAYSKALSKALKEDLETGVAKQFAKERQDYLDSLPKEPCGYCDSTGYRDWKEGDLEVRKVCNACNGELFIEPFDKHYIFSLELLDEFANFLEHCGGFTIC